MASHAASGSTLSPGTTAPALRHPWRRSRLGPLCVVNLKPLTETIRGTPNYLPPSLLAMSPEPAAARPSDGFAVEAAVFLEALEVTPPDALTGCALWRAHEVAAHLGAGAVEIARNLEAYGEGRPVPATRGFEEREAPYRAMEDAELRADLPRSIDRVAAALDAVLGAEPDAVVPWTGRQMVVATFVTHLRSELALHRFDLVGDDETSRSLLGQPELTDHALAVLGRALVARGATAAPAGFAAVIAAPGASDLAVVVDGDGPRLERSDARLEPAVVGDPAARLLLLWGRQPGDPRRLVAPGGVKVLGTLRSLLAGY